MVADCTRRTVPPERLMAMLGPDVRFLKTPAALPRSSPVELTVTVVAFAVAELVNTPTAVVLNVPELIMNCVPVASPVAAVESKTVPLPTKVIVRAVPLPLSAASLRIVLALAVLTTFRVALPDRVTAPVVSCAVPLATLLPACTVS